MSCHSRNSSDDSVRYYGVILRSFLPEFLKDFEYRDYASGFMEIFKGIKFAYEVLESYKTNEEQIIHIFGLLCSNERLIENFLDMIQNDYPWLVNAVRTELKYGPSEKNNRLQYFYAVQELENKNHEHIDFNVCRTKNYRKLWKVLKHLKRQETTVLFGGLGTGKLWLTIDVCRDIEVMQAMDFKIFWINVSNCTSPEHDLEKLKEFRILLGTVNASYSISPTQSGNVIQNRILEFQQNLKEKLSTDEYKNCLLVLINVQNVKTWKAFNLGCKLLITTRSEKVKTSLSTRMSKHINIDECLTVHEFYQLFLNCKHDKFPENAIDIYDASNGNPLLLSIIARNLWPKNLQIKEEDWNDWINKVKGAQVGNKKLTTITETAINILTERDKNFYLVFSIFQHSIPIPTELLQALWKISEQELNQIIKTFEKYSFVESSAKNNKLFVTVPFIYSLYLTKKNSDLDETNLHQEIVKFYQLDDVLNDRIDIALFDTRFDNYFFEYIGYHLKKAGYYHFFRKLFLDFGFLEQKLRAVGLVDTLSDLKFYREYITNKDPRDEKLCSAIRDFLPEVEEKICGAMDTCLLQYALICPGLVSEEAKRQIQKFPQRVWFEEKGAFHQRRQIVNLPGQAKFVLSLEDETCLVVLDDNQILLISLSLHCKDCCVSINNNNDNINGSRIIQNKSRQLVKLVVFSKNNFILTLNELGELQLWSIAADRRRSAVNRSCSNKRKVNHSENVKYQNNKCKKIDIIGEQNICVGFHLEEKSERLGGGIDLHIALQNGNILVYEWIPSEEMFRPARIPKLETNKNDIFAIEKIFMRFYLVILKSGDLAFWNVNDSGRMPVPFEWEKQSGRLLSYEIRQMQAETQIGIIFVFSHKIIKLILGYIPPRLNSGTLACTDLKGNSETLYEWTGALDIQKSQTFNADGITCAKLSRDSNYLVIGTKQGLIVYDMHTRQEIQHTNVSEITTCVDIYDLDDQIYKYIIICGSKEKKVLKIFALRKKGDTGSMSWSHVVNTVGNKLSDEPKLEPGVWLCGHTLYDITTYGSQTRLVAADSKYRIHEVCTTKKNSWSITPAGTTSPITAITACGNEAFVGYSNGEIFNLKEEQLMATFTQQPILYLKLIDENILIASSRTELCIFDQRQNISKIFPYKAEWCFKWFEKYLLIVCHNGDVELLDIENEFKTIKSYTDIHEHQPILPLGGCDFKNSHLFLASAKSTIYHFFYNDMLNYLCNFNIAKTDANNALPITCLIASNQANLVAIGYGNGDIELHKFTDKNLLEKIFDLNSHISQIYDMKFSPDNKILVTCAEQLCFWDVTTMTNNPFDPKQNERHSSRYNSQASSNIDGVDADMKKIIAFNRPQENILNELFESNMQNPWDDKHGPSSKPELLACIKFDGNCAKKFYVNSDFTQFNTIDDEGVYYHLTLYNNVDSGNQMFIDEYDGGADEQQYGERFTLEDYEEYFIDGDNGFDIVQDIIRPYE